MIELSDFYPSPAELISNEVSVLDYLRSNPYIKEKHPQVARDAHSYYERNRIGNSSFTFNTHFDVVHSAGSRKTGSVANTRLTVSAGVWANKAQFTNITYCLSVCRVRKDRVTILRKFHFDIAAGAPGRSQPHPRCHLQYCGTMLPYMSKIGCRDAQLAQMQPWLSEPRIFFWPMALALLIDLALHEFPDQSSAKFRADSYWRQLVRNQEILLLQPFYQKCLDVIADEDGEKHILADVFYVS